MASCQSLFAFAATLATGSVAHASLQAGVAANGDWWSVVTPISGQNQWDDASPSLLQRVAKKKGEEASSSGYMPALSEAHCAAKLVVDVGLPRTSTVSFSFWVNKLGYTSIHHLPDYGCHSNTWGGGSKKGGIVSSTRSCGGVRRSGVEN